MNAQTTTKIRVGIPEKIAVMTSMLGSLVIAAGIISFTFSLFESPSQTPPASTQGDSLVANSLPLDMAAFREAFAPSIPEKSSSITVNNAYTEGAEIDLSNLPLISSIRVSGSVQLHTDDAYVRVVLRDAEGVHHLVYEAGFPFEEVTTLDAVCDETCIMDPIQPDILFITISSVALPQEFENAIAVPTTQFDFASYTYATADAIPDENTQRDAQTAIQERFTIETLNNKGRHWTAGETDFAKLSYQERLNYFDTGTVPHLCGLEYYTDGIFEYCKKSPTAGEAVPSATTASAEISEDDYFSVDWRDRHGINMTTVARNQQQCGSCWAFAAVGAAEAQVDRYYNQDLNMNFAEQDLISCASSNGCSGQTIPITLDYALENGFVPDTCYPYQGVDATGCTGSQCGLTPALCSARCETADTDAWRSEGYQKLNNLKISEDVKQAVIEYGPLVMTENYLFGNHALVLVGFGEIAPYQVSPWLDDPLIGKTYWTIKNSWGNNWGQNGFANIVYTPDNIMDYTAFYALTPPVAPTGSSTTINCTDRDNDGFCYWGASDTIPDGVTCPATCAGNTQKDIDDGDADMQIAPANYFCGNSPMRVSAELDAVGSTFGESVCCGDDLGEAVVGGYCCAEEHTVVNQQSTLLYDTKWGTRGDAFDAFNSPRDIASSDDSVFVLDAINKRVTRFDVNGTYQRHWQVNALPQSVAVYNGTVYVGSYEGQPISLYNENGLPVVNAPTFTSAEVGEYQPNDIHVDASGLYVADALDFRIIHFALDGTLLAAWPVNNSSTAEPIMPSAITVHDTTAYVAVFEWTTGRDAIYAYDLTGQLQFTFGATGSYNQGGLFLPQRMAITHSVLYVANTYQSNIQEFSLAGEPLRTWGTPGSRNSEFTMPEGIDVSESGNVFIADTLNYRVQTFSPQTAMVCSGQCSDGTALNTCSSQTSFYCTSDGQLIEDCQLCGCSGDAQCQKKIISTCSDIPDALEGGDGQCEASIVYTCIEKPTALELPTTPR